MPSAEVGHLTGLSLQGRSPLCHPTMAARERNCCPICIVHQPMGAIQREDCSSLCMYVYVCKCVCVYVFVHVKGVCSHVVFSSNPGFYSLTTWKVRHLAGQPIRGQLFEFMPGIFGLWDLSCGGKSQYFQSLKKHCPSETRCPIRHLGFFVTG